MPGKARVRLTASEAREEFLARAGELWEEFDAWCEANPEATFDEMEEQLGRRRRAVLGELLELRLRQDDLRDTRSSALRTVWESHGLQGVSSEECPGIGCRGRDIAGVLPLSYLQGRRFSPWTDGCG